MTSILTIVGARPQFVKASMVSRALEEAGFKETLVHTGQHYDAAMSSVFFEELGIPTPAINLGVGSGTHASQTGEMMVRLEHHLAVIDRPDCVLVYGDTNSTVAASLVASKMHIPIAHVEAGLRSFNRRMPEEINRIVTDRLSSFLFCPTETAVRHLSNEGMSDGVYLTGDVMRDATLFFCSMARESKPLADIIEHLPGRYVIATIHRAENTDDPDRLAAIMRGLGQISVPVILPVHPRTRKRLVNLVLADNIRIIEPVSYLEMLTLVQFADRVLTDSGGLQKESIWLETPCITLRDETEWTETLDNDWNQVVGADADRISDAFERRPDLPAPAFGASPGGDSASECIVRLLGEVR